MIKHHFAGGVYAREQTLDAGQEVQKHMHNYDHLSFLCSGIATLEVDDKLQTLHGPCGIEVKAGKVHKIYAVTDIVWLCIHAESLADESTIVKE